MTTTDDAVRPVLRPPSWLEEHALAVTRLRRVAMGGDTTSDDGRARLVRQHARSPGCRVATVGEAAPDDADPVDGESDDVGPPEGLLAVAYGFPLQPGQWWRDTVATQVGPAATQQWLDGGFELAELHVHPQAQARGTGRAVLSCLLSGVPHASLVLSTPDRETRARRLYRQLGFRDLAGEFRFPGDPTPYALLAAPLPLPGGDPTSPPDR